MTANITTTNIGKEYQKELKKLSQSWGMSQTEFLNKAIWYFKKTGINPNSTIFSPKEEISKLTKRVDQVIKFISRQERDKLSPLLDELIITERRLKESLSLGIDKNDLEKVEKKIGEVIRDRINSITDIYDAQIEDISDLKQRLSSLMQQTNTKIEKLSVKNEVCIELISILFNALKSRGITGKFNQNDITNFNNAIHKI